VLPPGALAALPTLVASSCCIPIDACAAALGLLGTWQCSAAAGGRCPVAHTLQSWAQGMLLCTLCSLCITGVAVSAITMHLHCARPASPQVGEVLVERTVGEVLPAVKTNRDNLAAVRRRAGRQQGSGVAGRAAGGHAHSNACPIARQVGGLDPTWQGIYAHTLFLPSCAQLVANYEKLLAAKQKEVLAYQEK